ncbi:helix-turn-helix domain-containing protein [Burkholderia ambifaria]|uniref:helix-turn-helix domain-containing protein n=1 Tax=Burkholderia ambifaria TaxID=152480 RepID=UPI001FC8D366|nr:helix-turn-helix transcriptional regulator [Burkholderia ambifaria]
MRRNCDLLFASSRQWKNLSTLVDTRCSLSCCEQLEKRGLTQEEVAARLETTQTFINKCERGERRLDVIELCSWCETLGIPASQFVAELEQKM